MFFLPLAAGTHSLNLLCYFCSLTQRIDPTSSRVTVRSNLALSLSVMF